MDPEQNHVVSSVFVVGGLGEHDAFGDFADFSEIELIVELLGSGTVPGVPL